MSKNRNRHINLNNQRWRLVYTDTRDNWGTCEHSKRVIRLHHTMTPGEQLAIALHEALHAIYPFLSEEVVEQNGRELTRLVRVLGFIHPSEIDE